MHRHTHTYKHIQAAQTSICTQIFQVYTDQARAIAQALRPAPIDKCCWLPSTLCTHNRPNAAQGTCKQGYHCAHTPRQQKFSHPCTQSMCIHTHSTRRHPHSPTPGPRDQLFVFLSVVFITSPWLRHSAALATARRRCSSFSAWTQQDEGHMQSEGSWLGYHVQDICSLPARSHAKAWTDMRLKLDEGYCLWCGGAPV